MPWQPRSQCSVTLDARKTLSNLPEPLPHVRALLWDIDGTLINTTDLIVESLDRVYRMFLGRTLPRDEIRAIIGMPLYKQVCFLGDPTAEGVDPQAMEREFIAHYEANRGREQILPDVIEVLRAGHLAGLGTALVTSKNHAEIANTLPRLGISDDVDVVVTAEDVPNPKPAPDGARRACELLSAAAEDAVFIGDTVHDLRAGRSAGNRVVAVTWGAGPRPILVSEAPDRLCDDPSQLAASLGLRLPVHS